jgi:23S rRNA (cytosine1962-C5)-methyltransferase
MAFEDIWRTWEKAWILFEDEDVILVDKPAGVSTHAPEPDRSDDAHSRLTEYLRARGAASTYLGIHQRLDRDTSGVLLFTRRKEANRAVAEQFEGRKIEKTYVACVTGLGKRDRGVLEHRLVPGQDGVMRALPKTSRVGQEAVTRFRVLDRKGDRGLLELTPETGRTHQIRVQLAAEKMPIVGDPLYGGVPAPRLLLHASELRLAHPTSKKKLVGKSPVPPAFAEWLQGAPDPLRSTRSIAHALRAAAELRYGIAKSPGTTAFRIVNGGGDGLPGVTVDVYGEWLVVALTSPEAEAARERILDAATTLGPRGVYVKSRPKHASVIVDARREEFSPREAVRGESAPDSFVIHELGLPYLVRLGDGLSTGIFLDQRENRRRVRELAGGARVLNLFAYTGAFTVAAAAGGARSSMTIDVSPGVIAWARQNLEGVGADPALHVALEADALPWLKSAASKGDRFDLVLLDPPSFATTKQSRFSAAGDYKKLAGGALRALAPGGRLLACTNHRGITRALFRRFLHEALRDNAREVVQMKDWPDPEDFPPAPGHEPHLKSVLVTVAGRT